ncbi:MAG TPA: histidine kinase N-terminal 7TM domain-containing protein, partial [Thermoanaerobaculia bacterium]|nr:histidine kinase N-terminal 7TM domain-containing protein [Thermoanaerobaculia bacterium]
MGSALALATLVTAGVILALGASVLLRARGARLGALFFIVTVCAAGWLAGFSAVYGSTEPSIALQWARVASFFSCLIPAAIFHFSATYAGRRVELRPL